MRPPHAPLQPAGALLHAVDGALQVAADGGAVRAFGLGDGLAQQGQGRLHHGQVDQVAAEHAVVGPAVGVGKQLARGHVQARERGHAAQFIGFACWRFELDGRLGIDHDARADAVLVGAQFAGFYQWRRIGPRDGRKSVRAREGLAQIAIRRKVRNDEVDIGRFAVFAVTQGDGSADVEQAGALAQQRAIEFGRSADLEVTSG